MNIALILITEQFGSLQIPWSLGEVLVSQYSVRSIAELLSDITLLSHHDAILLWDYILGVPDQTNLKKLLNRRVDVWHSGLLLGTSGKPELFDFVRPTWMFNADPDPNIEATSWRLSLRACLIRTRVLAELGSLNMAFTSLETAGLEFGLRCLMSGAIIRHTTELMGDVRPILGSSMRIAIDEQFRFLLLSVSSKFVYWSLFRAVITRQLTVIIGFKIFQCLLREGLSQNPQLHYQQVDDVELIKNPRVTVLIPTIDRYPFLRVILDQLRTQTVPPIEVIVVDQTNEDRRDITIADEFADLPLKLVYLNTPGQCSSRNVGLKLSQGDFILFLDDDDEISKSVIESHLITLQRFQADSSSGSVNEIGALPLTDTYRTLRLSDVFPTNNTLVTRSALKRSGLFDMAYERKQSEDGDLGMRLYLAGALMIYNPKVSVLHHRAMSGGLRTHKARVITFSSSRQRVSHRRIPHVSEVYLMKRFFTDRHVHEALLLTILGTFSLRGSMIRRLIKVVYSLILLPCSIKQIRQRLRGADELLNIYPDIPTLD